MSQNLIIQLTILRSAISGCQNVPEFTELSSQQLYHLSSSPAFLYDSVSDQDFTGLETTVALLETVDQTIIVDVLATSLTFSPPSLAPQLPSVVTTPSPPQESNGFSPSASPPYGVPITSTDAELTSSIDVLSPSTVAGSKPLLTSIIVNKESASLVVQAESTSGLLHPELTTYVHPDLPVASSFISAYSSLEHSFAVGISSLVESPVHGGRSFPGVADSSFILLTISLTSPTKDMFSSSHSVISEHSVMLHSSPSSTLSLSSSNSSIVSSDSTLVVSNTSNLPAVMNVTYFSSFIHSSRSASTLDINTGIMTATSTDAPVSNGTSVVSNTTVTSTTSFIHSSHTPDTYTAVESTSTNSASFSGSTLEISSNRSSTVLFTASSINSLSSTTMVPNAGSYATIQIRLEVRNTSISSNKSKQREIGMEVRRQFAEVLSVTLKKISRVALLFIGSDNELLFVAIFQFHSGQKRNVEGAMVTVNGIDVDVEVSSKSEERTVKEAINLLSKQVYFWYSNLFLGACVSFSFFLLDKLRRVQN